MWKRGVLGCPAQLSVTIVQQQNGGPGSARNTGLERVSDGTRYVAFLDSDDEWSSDHLARAVAALEQGYDFYFADLYQLGQTVGAFARAGHLHPEKHPLLAGAVDGLHKYIGDMFDQILRSNVIGTPTVVYSWQKFAAVRFRTEFTTAGEDYQFWMTLATQGAHCAFSSKVEATYGKGVNVYSGSGWGTEGHLLRVHQEIKFRLVVRKVFRLTQVQHQHVCRDLSRLRLAFVRDVLHRLSRNKPFPKGLLIAHLKTDPLTAAGFPWFVIQVLLNR